jgi:hypothetical protein
MRHPALTATWWGGAGLLGGVATGVLVLLPLYPEDDSGFEGLGWFLMAMALGALLGLVAGAALLQRGLRRAGAAHPGRTALAFVPIAVLLAAVTVGVGALAAPALAHWVVDGFTRRPGWGPVRAGGLAQRLVVTLVVSAGLASWGLATLGYELGGRVGGVWLTWAAVLPAVVVPPVLLLRTALPWRVLAAGIAAAALLLGLAAPGATRNAHPTSDRLEQIARDLPVPPGQSVTAVRSSVLRNISWDVPVTLLSTGGPAPALGFPLPADPRGVAAARQWEAALVEQGWVRTSQQDTSTYWLPDAARGTLEERPIYELGLWTRAAVVPYGDGALVLLSVRP